MTKPRRTVRMIKQVLSPKEIFALIHKREWEYSLRNQAEYAVRDRAMMAACYATAGRISEVCGGIEYQIQGGKKIQVGTWNDGRPIYRIKGGKAVSVGRHLGLQRKHLEVNDKFIKVSLMPIVKRSRKLKQKLGDSVAQRDPFLIPLVTGLYENRFYDQLIPFGHLILYYLKTDNYKVWLPERKVFPFQDNRAWQIIEKVTGWFPNWFRMQADNFYGPYITKDSGKHSDFVGRVHAESSRPYTRFVFTEGLRDQTLAMDFTWIEPAVQKIYDEH